MPIAPEPLLRDPCILGVAPESSPPPKNRLSHFSYGSLAMISTKRLLQMAKKWQRMAAHGRRRITWLKPREDTRSDAPSAPSKGNFVVQSQDGRRCVVPSEYVNTGIITRELFEISEEAFGLPCDGSIVMPCDAALMEYVVSLLPTQVSKDVVEKAVVSAVAAARCSSSSMCSQEFSRQQLLVR